MGNSVRVELVRLRKKVYVFALEIGMNETKLHKILSGRMKTVSDEDLLKIVTPLGLDPAKVRAEIEADACVRREEAARAA